MTTPTDALVSRRLPSPMGALLLVASQDGIRALLWPGEDVPPAARPAPAAAGIGQRADQSAVTAALAHLDRAGEQLGEYFAGRRRAFDLALDPRGTAFQLRAWRVLRTIPFGGTISYREQATALGNPAATRAVGAANGRNPISILVPCHRVIATSGSLTGYGGGLQAKAWLLDHERRVLAGPDPSRRGE